MWASPGFSGIYKLNYKNVGTTALSNVVIELNLTVTVQFCTPRPLTSQLPAMYIADHQQPACAG